MKMQTKTMKLLYMVKSLPNGAEKCCGLDPDSHIVIFDITQFVKR